MEYLSSRYLQPFRIIFTPGIALINVVAFMSIVNVASSQETHVVLNQGTVVGLKVFPESSRTPVYTFLGVPFAKPPVDELRFYPPQPHRGWNQTYLAKDQKPICFQLTNSIYDETVVRGRIFRLPQMSEDCLYLNIWTPESGLKYGNLPVLAMITGEEMAFDWPQNRPTGLDLSAEGIVVITIQYRTNIFGWLGVNSNDLSGNYGFYDQILALNWIQFNIQKFGGNPNQVTLLGHGTTGAVCALLHYINPRNEFLFHKVILMSPSIIPLKQIKSQISQEISLKIIQKLGCQATRGPQIANCLRTKSIDDLLRSYESVYSHGNYTNILGPILDTFRNPNEQFIPKDPMEILRIGQFRKIPILIGINTNEGAFIRDYWIDLAREGHDSLWRYINTTIIPNILSKYSLWDVRKYNINGNDNTNNIQIMKAINWRYFEQNPRNSIYLLNSLQRLISEAEYEAPFYELIEYLAKGMEMYSPLRNQNQSILDPQAFFVYAFEQRNSMDMRGKINFFGGASHSSDLPLLLGPSLLQQIARRRITGAEDKLCRRLRQLFCDFLKNSSNPTPGRIFDTWHTYSTSRQFIKLLGEEKAKFPKDEVSMVFEEELSNIEEMLQRSLGSSSSNTYPYNRYSNPYQLGDRDSEDTRKGKSSSMPSPASSYLTNPVDYAYYHHLKKVYSFWNILLPSIGAASTVNMRKQNEFGRAGHEFEFIDADTIKYKHAFFSMLAIVCLLLGILGLCVYILRKHHPSLSSNL